MTRVQKWVAALLVVVAILAFGLIGFSLVHKTNTKKQEVTATSASSVTRNRAEEKTEQAKHLAKQYDYDGAIEALEGEDTKTARKLKTSYEQEKEQLVAWKDPEKISHVFVHSLIVDTDKAFNDKEQAQGYKDYMITISEFEKTIQQLYDNGYVLVTFDDLVKENSDGKLQFKGVHLPEGKKPLIFSQDDVNYYEYMKDAGFADKLVIDEEGKVKNTYEDNGQEKTGDYDMVPILDKFVEEHPDFSYQGSKGILALTGYNGALGYRTSKSEYGDDEKTEQEIEKAKEVANRLKDTGWSFASHTWGHINMAEVGQKQIAKDTKRWKDEVAPIIGNTDVLIYPHGADISDFQPYDENPKYDYLKQQGFRIFCNVDASVPSWGQFNSDYYRNARINLDGIRFESELDDQNDVLEDFINVKDIYDDRRNK